MIKNINTTGKDKVYLNGGTLYFDAKKLSIMEEVQKTYTIEELNARIDESEKEITRGEGKTFEEMMNGFKKELLWLK